jgi:dimethylaniline monooxygenase (N-oxide forming)
VPFDCFEKGSKVGGNWCFRNDNGLSSAYDSLELNSSKTQTQYAAFPMPRGYPDYPGHRQVQAYFEAFVDHFGLDRHITFRTEVTRVGRAEGGTGFAVTLGPGEVRRYRWVLVANGHHWSPRWPDPPFPGHFDGRLLHSHHYKEPEQLAGARVVVVGLGNSACDFAVDGAGVAARTVLSVRRGAHVTPKYLFGRPIDVANRPLSRLPLRVRRVVGSAALRLARGSITSYGLPRPDHPLYAAHPTLSSRLLGALRAGTVTVRPQIERLDGSRVHFSDGSTEDADVIVACTGYRVELPFLCPELSGAEDLPLYRRVVDPEVPGLFYIGFLQPQGSVIPLAELQSVWVSELITGRVGLPEPDRMRRSIRADRAETARRFVAAPRHALEVDARAYRRELGEERRRFRLSTLP